jgi:hypothetical protein
MADEPALIVQVPRGSAIERQLRDQPPSVLTSTDVLVQTAPTDGEGNLEEMAGQVVLSVPSPEELARHAEGVERVLRDAGTGTAPLVIVVEAAEEFEAAEVKPVVDAARRALRPVILRVIRPSER